MTNFRPLLFRSRAVRQLYTCSTVQSLSIHQYQTNAKILFIGDQLTQFAGRRELIDRPEHPPADARKFQPALGLTIYAYSVDWPEPVACLRLASLN